MNDFITPDNFNQTPYNVPADQVNTDSFQAYMDSKVEMILKKILGVKLYGQFIKALEDDYPAEKWVSLRDGAEYECHGVTYEWEGLEKLLIPFIYAHWLRDTFDNHASTGISVSKVENAEMISPALRIVQAHNDFWKRQGNCNNQENSLYGFMIANEADYPDWDFTDIGPMNRFNL